MKEGNIKAFYIMLFSSSLLIPFANNICVLQECVFINILAGSAKTSGDKLSFATLFEISFLVSDISKKLTCDQLNRILGGFVFISSFLKS